MNIKFTTVREVYQSIQKSNLQDYSVRLTKPNGVNLDRYSFKEMLDMVVNPCDIKVDTDEECIHLFVYIDEFNYCVYNDVELPYLPFI